MPLVQRFTALALIALVTVLGGCASKHVEFTQGECLIEGRPATLVQVEATQAELSERILARQPILVGVTVLIVLLAGASHIEKVVLLFGTRKSAAHGLGERLRLALDRYRAYPVRYFALVASTLLLLGFAGGFYVYLDAEKRASERSLGLLQFCHLALRDTEARGVLDEQRHNLEVIQSTAGDIRTLVDKLPPEEQKKAQDIVEHINSAIGRQGRLVGDYLEKTSETTRSMEARTANIDRGVLGMEASLAALKSLPGTTSGLAEQLQRVDGKVGALDQRMAQKLDTTDAKVAELQAAMKTFLERPEKQCPACVCVPPVQAAVTHPPPPTSAENHQADVPTSKPSK